MLSLSSQVGVMLCLTLAMASCRREEQKKAPPPEDPGLPALAAPAPASLPVPGFGEAAVSAPLGITRPAPTLVAVLGIGDTPESQCGVWKELVGDRAFVVCPRFKPHYVRVARDAGDELEGDEASEPGEDAGEVVQSGYFPADVEAVEREVEATVAALRARFGPYVAAGPAVYAGFSRGAFLGASFVAKHPDRFPRAILIEGGQSAWNDATAAAFANGGGKRVLFACGQPSCVSEAESAAQFLARAHVETRVVHGQGEGHGYKRQVKEQVRQAFAWVTEGDPAWRQPPAPQPARAELPAR